MVLKITGGRKLGDMSTWNLLALGYGLLRTENSMSVHESNWAHSSLFCPTSITCNILRVSIPCSHLTSVIPKDKFPQSPYVLVSSKHTYSGRKHDAATVWAEDIEKGKFTVCLREMQNFDGMHENITVVSISQFCIMTQSTPLVNSGHCRDLELVSSLATVCNNGCL